MLTSGVRSIVHVIVLVEDDAGIRRLYARALRETGLVVEEASTKQEARVLLHGVTANLVLLDRQLPDGDGWDIVRALKADESTRAIPVVGFTSHRERSDVEGALVAGCDAFLEKGCTSDFLVRYVRGMLGMPLDRTDEHAVLATARGSRALPQLTQRKDGLKRSG